MRKLFILNLNSLIFNLSLLIFLFIGIQNSSVKNKVLFLGLQSVEMPISFITCTSFIFGSLYSNLIFSVLAIERKKKNS